MAIHYFQFNAYNNTLSFYNAKNQLVTIAKEAVPTHLITPILDVLENLKTEEESQIEKLEAQNLEMEVKLKNAQDALAKMVTGDNKATMTEEIVKLFPELYDGISIDAGDYYHMPGGLVLYRAKRDMSSYVAAEMSPEGKNGSTYWTGGGNDKQPESKPGIKYPKGTEVDYMGVRYYATVDTNDGPETGYPTWDLAQNKPL